MTTPPSAVTSSQADEVVAGEPVLAHQPADAAAERQPGDAGPRDDAARHGEAVQVGLAVDVAQGGAALDAHGARSPDRR